MLKRSSSYSYEPEWRKCSVFFWVSKIFLFSSEFKRDYRALLFVSCSVTVTEWPSVMLVFWEIVAVQQESTKA